MVGGHGLVEGTAAAGTGLGEMVDGGIGGFGLAQRLAGMARLSAGLFAGFLTKAGDADRLFQPITGGGLAAVGAVQAEPTFQFGDARMQGGQRGGMMRLLRQKQRNEVVLRKLAKGGVFHRLLRIWNLPLCQSEIAPPLHQNRLLAAWPGKLTEPGEPGQLPRCFTCPARSPAGAAAAPAVPSRCARHWPRSRVSPAGYRRSTRRSRRGHPPRFPRPAGARR